MEQKLYITKCIRLMQCFAIRTELKRAEPFVNRAYLETRIDQNEAEITELQNALAVADEKKLGGDLQQVLISTTPDYFTIENM